MATKGKTESVW